MLPSTVPASCSKKVPSRPASLPVTRSIPAKLADPSARAACKNSTAPSPSMSPLKLSCTWILVSTGPSAGSSYADGSYLCTVITALARVRSPTGTTVRVCDLPGKSSGSCWRCLELCLVVVPSGACLVASSPDAPGAAQGPARGCREQPARFGYRDADQAHVAGRLLAGAEGELAGVAPVFGLVSGSGAGPRRGGARMGRCPG